MLYLLLAILSSTTISVFMRLGDKMIKNDMVMFFANYAICTALSIYFMRGHMSVNLPKNGGGLFFALGIGIISGFMYLISFVLFHLNINRNGMVLSSVFMRLGVLVPTSMAIFLFHEKARVLQIIGFACGIVAIILMNLERDGKIEKSKADHDPEEENNSEKENDLEIEEKMKKEKKKGNAITARLWLLILLLLSGLTDSLANIYDKKGVSVLKDHYLLATFLVACLLCIVFIIVKKQRFTLADLFWGVIIGIPNYFSARFLLLALAALPAIIVYPVYNVATILAICLFGVFAFRERMGRLKIAGLIFIVVALVLLNL